MFCDLRNKILVTPPKCGVRGGEEGKKLGVNYFALDKLMFISLASTRLEPI